MDTNSSNRNKLTTANKPDANFKEQLHTVQNHLSSPDINDVWLGTVLAKELLLIHPEEKEVYDVLLKAVQENSSLYEHIYELITIMTQHGSKTAASVLPYIPVTAKKLMDDANIAYFEGDFREAVRLYRKVLDLEPDNRDAQQKLIKAEEKIETEQESGKIGKKIPPEAERWYRQARSYIAAKDYQTAVVYLSAAIDAAEAKNIEFTEAKNLLITIRILMSSESALENDNNLTTNNNTLDNTPISVLFLSAEPEGTVRLKIGEEMREIHSQLQLAEHRDQFTTNIRLSSRPIDVSQALLDLKPNIVHFSGHGSTTGALYFENKNGQAQLVTPEALQALFEQFSSDVNCVVLNACYSEIQAHAIAQHIDWVIGMHQEIGDDAAIAFSIGFYQALGAGKTIEEAFKLGVVQIMLQGIPAHLKPVLIKKQQ